MIDMDATFVIALIAFSIFTFVCLCMIANPDFFWHWQKFNHDLAGIESQKEKPTTWDGMIRLYGLIGFVICGFILFLLVSEFFR